MTNIELTKEQVEELKVFYKIELEKSLKRTNEIKAILDKLDLKPDPIVKPDVTMGKPQKQKVISVPKETKKYLNWGDQILELLQEKQKPLSLKEIAKILVIQNNIPKSDLNKTNYAVQQSIYRLRTINKKLQAIKVAGKLEKLFGLTEWTKELDNIPVTTLESKSNEETQTNPQEIKTDISEQKEAKSILRLAYNWPEFVKETLKTKQRVLTGTEFLNHAMKFYNIKTKDKSSIKGKLAPVLSNLVSKFKILKSVQKKGIKGKSYGLKEWFDETGNLISIYK